MRSLLFVPGDSPSKLERGLASETDALILDLEDSVSEEAKPDARKTVAEFLGQALRQSVRPRLFVRINALQSDLADADLDAVIPARPDGIMLPKSERGADVGLLDARISAAEAVADIEDGAIRIIAIATESAAALFELGSYAGSSARLDGLTWGAEDLSADVGATTSRDDAGNHTDLYRLARALCLAGAAKAEVPAIDTVFTDFRDPAGLRRECEAAVRDGFTAKMAIHPAQLSIINEVFTPSEAAIDEAEAVLRAFALAGASGVTSLNGQMLDRPHRLRAERVVARARAAGKR